MFAFTPLALYPPTLLLLGFLIDNPAYFEYQFVLFILLIPFSLLSPLIGICLLLTSNLTQRQFIYFLICTLSASVPLLVFIFFGIRNWLNR